MKAFFDKIEWSPSIGDPTFMGWLTVFAYFVCFYKCISVLKYKDRIFNDPITRQHMLWILIACTMLLLGINKQLDLQTFFTATARYLAMEQGWYAERQIYQKGFIIGIGIVGLISMMTLVSMFYKVIQVHLFAIVGVCVLMVFVLIRALSFHNMDSFLSESFLGIKANWALELSGIILVYYNAKRLVFDKRPLVDLNELQQSHSQ